MSRFAPTAIALALFASLLSPTAKAEIKALKRTCTALQAAGASEGYASWYGDDLHGGPTASGEVFNQYDLTAAHKTIPFNSIVAVTYKDRTVYVRINDAGPYYGERIIDLSKEAARKLDMLEVGVAKVKLELIECGKKS